MIVKKEQDYVVGFFFYEATQMLHKRTLTKMKVAQAMKNEEGETAAAHLMIPVAVNAAFACELFIKSFLTVQEDNHRKHKLETFFNKLEATAKNAIIKITIEQMKDEVDGIEFYKKLKNISNTYKSMRYPTNWNSDDEALQLDFLVAFMEALYIYGRPSITEIAKSKQ